MAEGDNRDDSLVGHLPHSSRSGASAFSASSWNPLSRLASICAERIYCLEALDPVKHSAISLVAAEVAAQLGIQGLQLYQLVENRSSAVVPIGTIHPNKLFFDMEVFEQLTQDEQKAVITHELTHLTQGAGSAIANRLVAFTALAAQSYCDSRGFIGSKRISNLLSEMIERSIDSVAQFENEANVGGAVLTDIENMKRAILKIVMFCIDGHTLDTELGDNDSLNALGAQLDARFLDSHKNRIANGGTICQQFAALDAVAQNLQQLRSCHITV